MTETIPEVLRAIGAACDYLELDTLNEPEAVEIMTDLTSASEAVTLMLDALRQIEAFFETNDRTNSWGRASAANAHRAAREAIRAAEGEAVNG